MQWLEAMFEVTTFLLFFLIATVYATIGHAGASGYLAIMALLSFAPESIKPTSLVLNIVVASIASFRFIKAGRFDLKIFLAFAATSIPMSFLGGTITVDPSYFKLFSGIFLIVSAVLLAVREFAKPAAEADLRPMPLAASAVIGALIGLLSGLVGVGGGIFLSPIIIMLRWSTIQKASGIAALFILCNSVSGLLGHFSKVRGIDPDTWLWVIAVVIGGVLGSYIGTSRVPTRVLVGCLFLVLLSAGLKFVLMDFAK